MKEQYVLERDHDLYGKIAVVRLEQARNSLFKEQITDSAVLIEPDHLPKYFLSFNFLKLINNQGNLIEDTPVTRLKHFEKESEDHECIICGSIDGKVHPYFYHNRMAAHLHVDCIEELGEYILSDLDEYSDVVVSELL